MNHHATIDPVPPAAGKEKASSAKPTFDFLEKKMTGAEFSTYLGEDSELLPEDLLPALEDNES